jgi:hypothetical protein
MIVFVDIQHTRIADDPEKGPAHHQRREKMRRRIEQATGVPTRLIRYLAFSPAWARENGIRAVMISGNSIDWCDYDIRSR